MTSSAAILPTTVFALARRPEELPRDLRLRSVEWSVLFSLTGRHTVAQIGATLGLTAEQRTAAFRQLLDNRLIVERAQSLGEYLRAAGTVDDPESRTFAAFLRAAPARPPATPPVGPAVAPAASGGTAESPASRPTPSGDATRPPAPTPARPSTPPDGAPFQPLALPEEEIRMAPNRQEPSRALELRRLVRFIADRAGSPDEGHLDVYRVFLRIDPELLRRAGITTLRFDEERQVRDPELVARIEASVLNTLGVPCPPEVWA